MRKKAVDLQKLNPNWKLAADHGKAQLPGREPEITRLNSLLLCPCCLGVIHKQPVRLWENSKELFFLGYGFPMFYNTLQFCLMSVFILILIESGLLLYMSLQDTQCSDYSRRALAAAIPYKCIGFFVRLSRTSKQTTMIELLTRIFSFVAQLFLLLYFRDNQRKMAAYHIQRNIRITDFSIIFKNLPKVAGIKKKITDFLTTEFPETKPIIQDIFLIPAIDEYYDKEQQKQKMIEKKRKLMQKKHANESVFERIDKEMDHINEQMTKVCKQIEQKALKDQLYAQKAIVILENQKQKVEVLKHFKTLPKDKLQEYFVWMADEIVMKQAPDPKQIIWKNINFPKNQRWIKILQGWIVSILVLGAITGVFYALINQKGKKLDESLHGQDGYSDQQYQEAVAIVFIAISGVQFFNKFLLKNILYKLSDLQMPQTTSEHQFSYALKYTLGMFFTTAVMTLAVQAIQFQNYSGEYGVVEEQTIMFIFNAYFVPLLWITHPQYYIKKFMRWKYKNSKDYTQKQANELMEEFPYDIGKRYAEIIETMWFTFLYSSLIPLGSMFTFTGFIIYYWVDKYNLLRRSSISNKIESSLPLNAIKLLQITIFWKPVGEFLFDLQLRNQIFASTIVMLCVGFIYLILPWNKILDCMFQEKFNIKTVSYNEVKKRFTEVYQTVDPIRRQLAIEKFVRERKRSYAFGGGYQFNQYEQESKQIIDGSHAEINLITSNISIQKPRQQYSSSPMKQQEPQNNKK